MQSNIYNLMSHPSSTGGKLQMALNLFVTIPALQFFQASGLIGRAGRWIVFGMCLAVMCLIAAIFLGLPFDLLDNLNSACVVAGSVSLLIPVFRLPLLEREAVVFRAGLLIFVGFAIWTNAAKISVGKADID